MSVFVGDQLADVLAQIETGTVRPGAERPPLNVGVDALPPLPRDATDRNRTSPFAFTGNKFEFRSPGSSQSCAFPMTVLNTIVAESLDKMSGELEAFDPAKDFHAQLAGVLRRILVKHKRILFDGNGYDPAWLDEAAARGLPNLRDTPAALEALLSPASVALFGRYGVLSEDELRARHEVCLEEYGRKIGIEARLSRLMATTLVLPAAVRQLGEFAALEGSSNPIPGTTKLLRGDIAARTEELSVAIRDLDALLDDPDTPPTALRDAMAPLRAAVDALERLVADDRWPLPKYRELLFIREGAAKGETGSLAL